ncbi:DUF3179 domain-containing protein [Leucothrix pacifica]|uniref:DUF3179 domain-containing protein n=1 Tax=Leucothrix pacifica TaxID=1247513 RepID=A0A317CH63_9GAMM|nr:DUF3179 domain-containing protein [Leucothrix pacifica]PWQ95592.1 hypothetical protein DKW60_14330 [Leucothrix pacifica]
MRFIKSSVLSLIILCIPLSLSAASKNGFDLTNSLIPADQILQGGPPRDGIPSIDKPKFVAARSANFLKPGDRVIGVTYNGESRAYPINILNWHEIVNDSIRGKAVSVTYCPLCGTGLVYEGSVNGRALTLGVSGLLYNSDVLLYDRETQTLWSQILSKAINGPLSGQKLTMISSSQTSWAKWLKQHPNTKVLSTDTGFNRDYTRSPYGNYDNNTETYFPVNAQSRQYHPKERVMGITINGKHKAYPFAELAKLGTTRFQDQFQGKQLTLEIDVPNRDGKILDANGKPIDLVNGFWFAWYAFHPDTTVFKAGQ